MIQSDLKKKTWKMVRKAVAISMTARSQYFIFTVNVVALEKVSFSDRQNLKTVCYHIHSP